MTSNGNCQSTVLTGTVLFLEARPTLTEANGFDQLGRCEPVCNPVNWLLPLRACIMAVC